MDHCLSSLLPRRSFVAGIDICPRVFSLLWIRPQVRDKRHQTINVFEYVADVQQPSALGASLQPGLNKLADFFEVAPNRDLGRELRYLVCRVKKRDDRAFVG